MERITEFQNRKGLKLTGILHVPDNTSISTGILFVHAGVQGRHGNTNQYVLYAREYCKMGFPCLRFDPYGLGDSEGAIESMEMRDFYGSIQTGRYVEDTIAAAEHFKSLGVKKIILFGLCGGAITSLLAASFLQDISRMILMSIPTMLDSSKTDYGLRIPKEIAQRHMSIYLKKMINPRYLLRFLFLKSNYKEIFSYIKAFVRRNPSDDRGKDDGGKNVMVNQYFMESYNATRNRSQILWVFGDNDSFWYDFKRAFYGKNYMGSGDRLVLIKGANHMFSLIEWQTQILAKTKEWLNSEKLINMNFKNKK